MSSKGYTDQTAIENYLLQTIDGSFLTQLDEWIAGIELYIDGYTGRNFIADSTATTRLYEGKLSNKLLIDDCVAVTVVEQGDTYGEVFTVINSGDYQLLPYNDIPKNAIGLKRTIWDYGVHRITAKWGYSTAVPADIKFVATVLVAGILNVQIKTGAAKKRESIGNYSVEYTTDQGIADYARACGILDGYKRFSL